MERREPKFNVGYEFLEDERILELEKLVEEVLYTLTPNERRQPAFEELQDKWNRIQKEYIDKAIADSSDLEIFLRFVEYRVTRMDKGGMSVGRHPLSNFIDEKAKELRPYREKYLKEDER